MSSPALVLTPRSSFDRRLARLEQQRIFEHTPAAVDLEIQIAREVWAMANEEKASQKQRLEALKFLHTVLKDTFLDRTIPVISRLEFGELVQRLPVSIEEASEEAKGDPEAKARAEFLALISEAAKERRVGIVTAIEDRRANGGA